MSEKNSQTNGSSQSKNPTPTPIISTDRASNQQSQGSTSRFVHDPKMAFDSVHGAQDSSYQNSRK